MRKYVDMKVIGCNTLQYLLLVTDIRLPVCPHLRQCSGDGLWREHAAGQWSQDLGRHVGVQTPGRGQLHSAGGQSRELKMKMMSVIVTWMCALVGDNVCNSAHGTNWLVSRRIWTFTFYWSFTIITLCLLLQVKPKLTQVRDISKKGNKDAADDVGIFMGDGE